ncbi:agamous-like MADS-box protein AGL61 [Mangifera indica]|uniref:agamous-like MADS-box protein AGL61 n=1 Tax=Mangifera indica TaxID=29780 RepID=UPI001CF9D099|nr:agamous-like MADS-box protein AGL61 [Mangifera indica]XP_044497531.1 agamous-like MADS-box protein AGL61 [Mangifera indica]XP_044497532.1 agamous-like MADS-box protein AGL61 [Mangifera indica]
MCSSSSAEQQQDQEAEPIRIKKKRNGTGRKKIEMKKIEKNSSRKVAFSKRRKGLFKKGCELCRLCGAMIAIIVFSPKGRVYSYGYPTADFVIKQFQSEADEENQYNVGDERGSISLPHEENCETDCVSENSATEEEEENEEVYWWEEDIEGLELEELERRRACMEELRDNMASSLEEIMERRFSERDLLGNDRVPR